VQFSVVVTHELMVLEALAVQPPQLTSTLTVWQLLSSFPSAHGSDVNVAVLEAAPSDCPSTNGVGLRSLFERSQLRNGALTVQSSFAHGTLVQVEIPL
jgi:hypothetical protein